MYVCMDGWVDGWKRSLWSHYGHDGVGCPMAFFLKESVKPTVLSRQGPLEIRGGIVGYESWKPRLLPVVVDGTTIGGINIKVRRDRFGLRDILGNCDICVSSE